MDIRVLKYFVTVANEGSMTKAADILHITQPTLSHQLKALEEELGCKLFQRTNYSIKLTDEGVLLRDRAEDILKMVQKTESEFKNLYSDMVGTIYFGCCESPHMADFMKKLGEFQKKYPKVQINIIGGTTKSLISALDNGTVDFALISGDFDHSRYDYMRTAYLNKHGILMKNNDVLADINEISMPMLMDLPLIICTQYDNLSPDALALIKDNQLNIKGSYNTFLTAISMLQADMGYVVCFDNMINIDLIENDFCFKPLSPAYISNMHIIWRKNRLFTPVTRALLDSILSVSSSRTN